MPFGAKPPKGGGLTPVFHPQLFHSHPSKLTTKQNMQSVKHGTGQVKACKRQGTDPGRQRQVERILEPPPAFPYPQKTPTCILQNDSPSATYLDLVSIQFLQNRWISGERLLRRNNLRSWRRA